MAAFYYAEKLSLDDKATKLMTPEARAQLADFAERLKTLSEFTSESIEQAARVYAEEKGLKLGAVAQPLRAALSGSSVSPPIFSVAALLGKDKSLSRIRDLMQS